MAHPQWRNPPPKADSRQVTNDLLPSETLWISFLFATSLDRQAQEDRPGKKVGMPIAMNVMGASKYWSEAVY